MTGPGASAASRSRRASAHTGVERVLHRLRDDGIWHEIRASGKQPPPMSFTATPAARIAGRIAPCWHRGRRGERAQFSDRAADAPDHAWGNPVPLPKRSAQVPHPAPTRGPRGVGKCRLLSPSCLLEQQLRRPVELAGATLCAKGRAVGGERALNAAAAVRQLRVDIVERGRRREVKDRPNLLHELEVSDLGYRAAGHGLRCSAAPPGDPGPWR